MPRTLQPHGAGRTLTPDRPAAMRELASPRQVRREEHAAFYGSHAWRLLSLDARRFMPVCCRCRSPLCRPLVADHVVPVGFVRDPLDLTNLQTMGHRCHALFKHADLGTLKPDPVAASLSMRDWRTPAEVEALLFVRQARKDSANDAASS